MLRDMTECMIMTETTCFKNLKESTENPVWYSINKFTHATLAKFGFLLSMSKFKNLKLFLRK